MIQTIPNDRERLTVLLATAAVRVACGGAADARDRYHEEATDPRDRLESSVEGEIDDLFDHPDVDPDGFDYATLKAQVLAKATQKMLSRIPLTVVVETDGELIELEGVKWAEEAIRSRDYQRGVHIEYVDTKTDGSTETEFIVDGHLRGIYPKSLISDEREQQSGVESNREVA